MEGAHRHATVFAVLLAISIAPPARAAEVDPPKQSIRDLKLFRLEFDNDNLLGSDDAFTAGFGIQFHSELNDTWHRGYAGWIGKLPGLGDDGPGGRIVRWAYSIGQIILTPKDITNPDPQPNDIPWAGMLGITGTWYSYDNKRLAALQVYVGCLGPCSHAEQVQRFIHEDLGLGDPPKGWHNQLSNEALANLNYELRYKLVASPPAAYWDGAFAGDMSIGAQGAVGNLTTRLVAEFEARWGWALPMGFAKVSDPPGIGMALDPTYIDPKQTPSDVKRWRFFFSFVARYHWISYLAGAEGGPTENGGYHPPLRPYPGTRDLLFGMHLLRFPYGFHVTYYRYVDSPPAGYLDKLDWMNFSFEYRF